MTRSTSCFAACAAFVILVIGLAATSEAANRHKRPHPQHAVQHRSEGEIQVTVLGHSGRPVAGATVHLHKIVHHKQHAALAAASQKPHHSHHRSGRTAVTNSAGRAVFKHVGGGHYHVTAHKKGAGHGGKHVSLRSGERKSVTIHLHRKHKGHARGNAGRRAHAPVAAH